MNPAYFGDSYDLVKRFLCAELSELGYVVSIDPMFTGRWGGAEREFFRLLRVNPRTKEKMGPKRRALLLDPDTGVNQKGGSKHLSFERIAHEAAKFELVFSFDQAFSRQAKPAEVMRQKLAALEVSGCYGMYYDSHARFLFAAIERRPLHELRCHLVALGLPASRLIESNH